MNILAPTPVHVRQHAPEYGLNWGLIVAVGLCVVFWATAAFGLVLAL
jgi:hypothetical protein